MKVGFPPDGIVLRFKVLPVSHAYEVQHTYYEYDVTEITNI
jgi:hypothetical protein